MPAKSQSCFQQLTTGSWSAPKVMARSANPWYAAAVWAIFILILCGIPGKHIPEITFWKWLKWDKVTHLALFGMQAYLLLRADRLQQGKKLTLLRIRGWVTLAIFYGAVIEILQLTVFTGRSADYRDAIANGLGAILGMIAFRYLEEKMNTPAGN